MRAASLVALVSLLVPCGGCLALDLFPGPEGGGQAGGASPAGGGGASEGNWLVGVEVGNEVEVRFLDMDLSTDQTELVVVGTTTGDGLLNLGVACTAPFRLGSPQLFAAFYDPVDGTCKSISPGGSVDEGVRVSVAHGGPPGNAFVAAGSLYSVVQRFAPVYACGRSNCAWLDVAMEGGSAIAVGWTSDENTAGCEPPSGGPEPPQARKATAMKYELVADSCERLELNHEGDSERELHHVAASGQQIWVSGASGPGSFDSSGAVCTSPPCRFIQELPNRPAEFVFGFESDCAAGPPLLALLAGGNGSPALFAAPCDEKGLAFLVDDTQTGADTSLARATPLGLVYTPERIYGVGVADPIDQVPGRQNLGLISEAPISPPGQARTFFVDARVGNNRHESETVAVDSIGDGVIYVAGNYGGGGEVTLSVLQGDGQGDPLKPVAPGLGATLQGCDDAAGPCRPFLMRWQVPPPPAPSN